MPKMLWKVVANRDESQIIRNNWKMSKTSLAHWSVNFAMDHECEKLRMKKATNELASLVSSLNLGSEEVPSEEVVQLAREAIIDAEYNMAKLVDLARGREIHLGSNLNEEPIKGNDVDDQPTPILKHHEAH